MSGSDSQVQFELKLASLDKSQYVKVYYLDIDAGISGASGLDRSESMAEVSEAITTWEAYRLTLSNPYSRAAMYIFGGASAYAKLTALPNYCDMIGVGAQVRGNGTGIARIGDDANTTPAAGVDAPEARGLGVYDLQFQAGSGYPAFDCDDLFRSELVRCAFFSNLTAVEPSAGLTLARASGLLVDECHWGGASGAGDPAVGLHVTGTHFHNAVVRNCYIIGDIGIQIDAACVSTYYSVVENSYVGSGYSEQTLSIDDNSLEGHTVFRNLSLATNGTLKSNGAGRWINNWITNGTAPVTVTAS